MLKSNVLHLMKIKYEIYSINEEVVNTLAIVIRKDDTHYILLFEDGISYDSDAIFDHNRKCFLTS